MFGRKKTKVPQIEYDSSRHKAIIRCSICTGEQVAGFRDKQTGEFTEVMLIRNEKDLNAFKLAYHLEDVAKEY
mgnify:CR=1 FL=1